MAHKTGYVPGIEHNMPGHSFAVTVLSQNVPIRDEPKYIMGEIGALLHKIGKSTIQ